MGDTLWLVKKQLVHHISKLWWENCFVVQFLQTLTLLVLSLMLTSSVFLIIEFGVGVILPITFDISNAPNTIKVVTMSFFISFKYYTFANVMSSF